MSKRIVKIAYYTGTGGTAKVAECFASTFTKAGFEVVLQQIKTNIKDLKEEHELLVLLFAVHAFNAPEAVYKWISKLEKVGKIPAVVISVSGGGEVKPNRACRVSSIKKLEKKGYQVVNEKMIVMPSNILIPTKQALAKMLLEVLPQKVKAVVDDVEAGAIIRSKPSFLDRLISIIGELEKPGTKMFGKRIRVSEQCDGCGWCVKNCAAGNITIASGKPKFGNQCYLCLNCIYGCPNKALQPGIAKLLMIKEGYDLKAIDAMEKFEDPVDIEVIAKGYLWSGVRKYLLEE